eukprot:scaffold382_cov380-Prasinococcus_capsulatus_cf.AAC.36
MTRNPVVLRCKGCPTLSRACAANRSCRRLPVHLRRVPRSGGTAAVKAGAVVHQLRAPIMLHAPGTNFDSSPCADNLSGWPEEKRPATMQWLKSSSTAAICTARATAARRRARSRRAEPGGRRMG